MVKSDAYTMNTYYMGMVDEHNKVNFYDGKYPSCNSQMETNFPSLNPKTI